MGGRRDEIGGKSGVSQTQSVHNQRALRHWCAILIEWLSSMPQRITLIPGDGIGPEVAVAARRIIEAAGVAVEWEEVSPRAHSSQGGTEPALGPVEESVR